jgi:two-component system cell cycle sensor histidine kinase/response regulator CckA
VGFTVGSEPRRGKEGVVADVLGAAVLSLTSDVIVVSDAVNLEVVRVNRAFSRIFGYSDEESLTLSIPRLLDVDSAAVARLHETLIRDGELKPSLRRYRRKDGVSIELETRVEMIEVEGRKLFCAVMRDQRELLEARRIAREHEERYRTLSEASFEGIAITEGGRVVDCNQQLLHLLGATREQLVGSFAIDFVAPEWRERLFERIKVSAGEPFRHVARRVDGSTFACESQAKTLRVGDRDLRITALRDISAQKKLEDELQKSQRIESLGRLAGGVAHDFNNLLTVILSSTNILLDTSRPEEEAADILLIQDAAERAADLTQQLLAFARRRITEPKVIDLNALIENLDKMLRRLVGEQISLATICAPDLGATRMDPGQVEQIVVNLVLNARDSMPEGGALTIETSNATLDEVYVSTHPEVTPGNYVMIAVSDTGWGMDEATLARIFEPFFTTKGPHHGSGLGLATCYGLVKQNRGSIWVYSEKGRGTTFKVYLPRVYEELSVLVPRPAIQYAKGTECVLLVEDDAAVRKVAVRALRQHGYEVLEASRPSEALAHFARVGGKIDVLVVDVVLPEMNGRKLAERLQEENPALPVLYTSGYTENTIVHQGVVDDGIQFLAKPYLAPELAARIRQLLDERTLEPKKGETEE